MSLLKEFLDIVCRKVCRLTQEVASLLDNHGIRRHWSHWINDLCSTPNKFWTRPGPALKARHHIYHFGPKTPWIGQVSKLWHHICIFLRFWARKTTKTQKMFMFFSRLLRDTCSNSAISRNFFSQRVRYFSQLVREILATSPGTYFLRFVVAFSPAPWATFWISPGTFLWVTWCF